MHRTPHREERDSSGEVSTMQSLHRPPRYPSGRETPYWRRWNGILPPPRLICLTHESVTIIGTSDPDVVRTKENDLNVLAMTVQDFEECLRIIRDRYTLNVFQHDPTRIVATDGKLRWQHTVTFRLGRPVN